jgi:Holliday junction resolvase
MSSYHDGRRVEWAVIHDLTENGYQCTRAASSKGVADVIAIKSGQVLLINVKRTSTPGPAERLALLKVAAMLPGVAVPILARKPPRQPIRYELMNAGTPRTWVRWTPDEVAPAKVKRVKPNPESRT